MCHLLGWFCKPNYYSNSNVANKVEQLTKEELAQKRKQFYEANLQEIIVDGKKAPLKSSVYDLSKKHHTTIKAEYLAASRYLQRNNLIQTRDEQSDPDDEDYTAFGLVSQKGEVFTLDISGKALFQEVGESNIKDKSQFSDHLTNIIFEATRKPCCWSFGRTFTQSGEVKLHAVCLNEGCNSTLVAYTDNHQSRFRNIVYNYDSNIQHSKTRYLTGNDEKQKVESILALESAMVTRAKLANKYIFEENEYAAHLCSTGALRVRKHRMNQKLYRHELSVIAVQIMKNEPQYNHTIGDIDVFNMFSFFSIFFEAKLWLFSMSKFVCLCCSSNGFLK